eukprot:CAMPEP_0206433254 /NCGR_PEP_ID=MMETSP0324_2-20121206/8424_1 /ASSEMBLY_ACC=CAM_ASM_000836 /TAXON_ID=2866 /ORGANISM="Crypthecodinium cohnii, Strain Seligo" /LENGTH=35 /DNA_ID= /DNA_START= /DNA_END= /DNA_ORIENTATION=
MSGLHERLQAEQLGVMPACEATNPAFLGIVSSSFV